MRPRHLRRRGALAAAATTLAVLCAGQTLAAPQAAAAPVSTADQEVRTSTASEVHATQDTAARAIAAALTDPAWRKRVRQAALTSDEVAVTALADGDLGPPSPPPTAGSPPSRASPPTSAHCCG